MLQFFIDILVTVEFDLRFQPTPNNAEKIMNVLKEFGVGNLEIPESEFLSKGNRTAESN